MSKIQEALRKLQSGQAVSKRKAPAASTVAPLARVVRDGALIDDFDDEDNGVSVEIDFELLRQAGLLAPTAQQRHIADQYRIIKRPLLDNAEGRGAYLEDHANLIMVASPLPGDGKTFNCLNLALSMATERDKSVVLVDADVPKPQISGLFGVDEEPGLIDLLMDSDRSISSVLLKTNVPGLKLLPAGRHDEHATELLASRRMAAVVDTLSTTFPDRLVIFDSPPLLVTSEARVLASFMGQIALVVCAGKTPRNAVLEAIESLGEEKALSIILNQYSGGLGADSYGSYGGYGYGNRESTPRRTNGKGDD